MVRSTLIFACVAVCFAQAPKEEPKPPADVDKALRTRVEEFFQDHVTGEYRKAEALVAEDSKDLFYNHNKPRYIKYVGIDHVTYSDNFTKAYAVVMVVSPEMIAGWGSDPAALPIPSTWKIDNGKWCWYVEPEQFLRTPFGNIPLNSAGKGGNGAPGMTASNPAAPAGGTAPPPGAP